MTRRPVLPLVLAGALLAVHALAYLRWTEDDAGITFRYAENLASGNGLVYNAGERVEAISNLGYALLLAPVFAAVKLPDHRLWLLLPVKLLGLAAAGLGLVEAARLARACALGTRASAVALVLIAGSGCYGAWAVGALETPFVAWATAGLVAASAELAAGDPEPRGARLRAGLFAAVLTLLRVDGFVLPVAMVALLAWRPATRGAALRVALAAAATFAAVVAFRVGYYGAPWPNPVHAKVELRSSPAVLLGTFWAYVRPFLRIHGGLVPLGLLAGAACLGRDPAARARRTAAESVAALCAYVTLVGGDWMPLFRFLVPAVIPLLVLATAGLQTLGSRTWPRASTALVLVLALALSCGEALAGRASFRTRRGVPLFWLHPDATPETLHAFWMPPVEWLAAHVPQGGLLITSEAGFVPWLSGLRTIDSYGLATRAIATLPRGSVVRSSLGVDTHFTPAEPRDPAERLLALAPADVLVLQTAMLRSWNTGQVPGTLLGGRWALVAGDPAGAAWAIYRPLTPPGSGSR